MIFKKAKKESWKKSQNYLHKTQKNNLENMLRN